MALQEKPKHAFPSSPEELTPDWLTFQLRAAGVLGPLASVVGFETAPVGVGIGMLGTLARVKLSYDAEAPSQPASLVAKFPTATLENRAVAMHFKLYEREARFYREIAAQVGEIAAHCYGAEVDPASGDNVILLEDLGAYRQGDQEAGCSGHDAELIADAIAPLHARYWGRAGEGELAWAPSIDSANHREGITGGCIAGWDRCAELFGRAMGPEILAQKDRFLAPVPELHRRMARNVVRYSALKPHWDQAGIARTIYIGEGAIEPRNTRLELVTVPKGGSIRPYRRPVEETFFVVAGCLSVGWDDGERSVEERLGPKDLVLTPAGRTHYFRNDGVCDAQFFMAIGSPAPEDIAFQPAR